MGRPATKPKALKDGFYIELRNKNANSGIKIRRDSKEEIDVAVEHYKNSKNVVYLGELKKGKWVDQANAKPAKGSRKAKPKAAPKAKAK